MDCELLKIIKKAKNEGWAVPAFNFSDCWELKAIIETAEELCSPVIVASAVPVVDTFKLSCISGLVSNMSREAKVPVFLHLDHSKDADLCIEASKCGYPSVMFDGSELMLDENIKLSRKVVEATRDINVSVEGEIGRIRGRNDESVYEGGDYLAKVEDAVIYANESGVDTLAVGLGNSHGFYKGKPEIDFNRLAKVNEKIDIPLVLHGGTGIPMEDIRRAIKAGISKVNIGTALHYAYIKEASKIQVPEKSTVSVIEIMSKVKEATKVPVREGILMCMSEGKA